tara:strand:- start:2699 stop:3388 length:690 start_codon:yes stop_codon:yes gene_type:complete
MIKDSLDEIVNDLKSKRDALSLAHQKLKSDSDDWNKSIIVLSLVTGGLESIKMKLHLDGAGWALVPILLSSVIAACSALIKFRNFPQRMETIINASGLITNILGKARNKKNIDEELLHEYNDALGYLETSLYPDQRKVFLKQSHKNLIEIMRQEEKYYDLIERVNNHEPIVLSDDSGSDSSGSFKMVRDELDITEHGTHKLKPIIEEQEVNVETIVKKPMNEEELMSTL